MIDRASTLTSATARAAERLDRAVAPSSPRYLAVATLVRLADGGSTVALVTLTTSRHHGAGGASGGILAALLTAPHLLGPVAAGPLARAKDPRRVLAAAFAGFGIFLALCGVLLQHGQLILAGATACIAGCSGPLLTGGLSTQVSARADGPAERQPGTPPAEERPDMRRAEAWDAATYGVGATLGPTVVAGIVTLASPVVSVVALGGAAVAAAFLALRLPSAGGTGRPEAAQMPMRKVFAAIMAVPVLRRTLAATVLAAFGTGGLLVAAVVFGTRLGGHTAEGAMLAAAFGVGSLTGSAVLIVRPLRREPESAMVSLLAVAGLLIALTAAAPDLGLAAVGFACAGGALAAQFTASLAVRSTYAPPGTRAHVFVTMAGLKMGCSALGAAFVGAVLALGPRPALLMISSLVLSGAVIATAMRRRTRSGPTTQDSAFSAHPMR